MKTHTSSFKEQIKLMGKEIDSRITFGSTVLGKDDLNAVTPSYQGAILKSVMKQLDIDSNVEIPIGTILKYEFGLKVNGEYEYINYGNYVVYSIEKQEDTNSYKIVCYDKLLYSMLDYVKLPITYPISIRDYINAISTVLGLKFANKSGTFANYDKQIQADLYDGLGYTFRDILDELAQVTASTICLNNNDELEIRYITETNDVIDEDFLKDVNVNFGEKFGAVNTIVLSRSGDSDSVYYPSVLPENPYEIKISDNQIMNGNDRADFLPDIYNKLNGLEFYTNDFVSTGICYYDLCDRYSVKVGDNTYSCVMFNDEVLVTQGLEENIYTELPEQTETDYKHASKDDRMINQVYLIVKKNEAEILAVINTTEQLQKEINPIKDESGSSITIEDASDNPLTYLEIEGKSTQETRSGKNLWNLSSSFTNDTTTGKWVLSDTVVSFPAGTYTFSNVLEGSNSFTLNYKYADNFDHNTSINSKTTVTFTEEVKKVAILLNAESSISNIQLEKGSTATEYEPYGASPSPDYPSEIESVGYENLYDYNTMPLTSGLWGNNNTNTITQNSSGWYVIVPIEGGKTYTISKKNTTGSIYLTTTEEYPAKDVPFVNNWDGKDKVTYQSIATNEKSKYLLIGLYAGKPTDTQKEECIEELQVEEGSVAHGYIPFGKYGIEVKTVGKNLFNINDTTPYTLSQTDGFTLTTNNSMSLSNYIRIEPNETYKAQCTIQDFIYRTFFYDKNKNYIGTNTFRETMSFDAYYVRLQMNKDFANANFQLEKGVLTEYQPYQERITVMQLNAPLRSLPNGVKDIAYIKNNNLYVDRYVGSVVLNGSESWGKATSSAGRARFHFNISNAKAAQLLYISHFISNYSNEYNTGYIGNNKELILFYNLSTLEEFKTWLSINNTQVDYELATPVTEELGEIEMLKTLKGYNNISTTDKLLPIINLTYVRDTIIADYVENHVTELKLTEEEIKSSVESVSSSVDGLNTTINRVEEITNDNSQVINVISSNIDRTSGEVREVTTTTGFTFNADGMTIDDGSGFKAEHRANGTYYKDGDSIVGQYTKDGSKQKDLQLFGIYSYGMRGKDDTPMFVAQLYEDEKGEECFGHFYNGGDY